MERCVRCIMPATAQGIRLNEEGLCQLCSGYREYVPEGEQKLREEIEPYRHVKGDYNAIVPVSGGRDSAYALYYAVTALGLKPLAVHNDNDFETEIAVSNLVTMTRKLDVPLIRIGTKKRLSKKIVAEKFEMNAPFGADLVVAQTCEACQVGFESAAYKIAGENGIALVLWGDSKDESTTPYHQLVPHLVPSTLRRFVLSNPLHLLAYKYYMVSMKNEYGAHSKKGLREIHLYDYIKWDPKVIVETIQAKLGWAAPESSPTTWRIDCSLVPVVNYLTEKAYGVSKIEIGFSTMIRNGKMDREDALKKVALIKQATDIEKIKSILKTAGVTAQTINRIIS